MSDLVGAGFWVSSPFSRHPIYRFVSLLCRLIGFDFVEELVKKFSKFTRGRGFYRRVRLGLNCWDEKVIRVSISVRMG